MSLYVVSGVRRNEAGIVEYLKWAPYGGDEPHQSGNEEVVPVSVVVASIDDGDIIDTLFIAKGQQVHGGRLVLKALPDGHVTVEVEGHGGSGRSIKDLPDF